MAHTLICMYAPHEHGQPLCYRVQSVACSGFPTVADIKCDVGATRAPLEEPQGRSAGPALPRGLVPDALGISRLVHEGFFYRFRVSIDHRRVGVHRAFWTPTPLLPFLERARADKSSDK